MADLLAPLNPAQRSAVIHPHGPALVVAGAGIGKTRVLTHRVAYLLQQGQWPESILMVTFTNKAAGEMKERIATMIEEAVVHDLWAGTFHSVAARILRRHAHQLGYPRSFSIYDADDSKNTVKRVVNALGLSTDQYKPKAIAERISWIKSHFITPEQYAEDSELRTADKQRQQPEFYRIYHAYQQRLFEAGAMDFDDLLLKWLQLLDQFPDILELYQRRFEHILVDEYQDTNTLQYLIIQKLATRHRNIFVVGDDAQSIYSFRGANYHNIRFFLSDYPDAKIYKLEQNYRSTQIIIEAANKVITHNPQLIPKKLWSTKRGGEKIKYYTAPDEGDEARYVISVIQHLHQQQQYPYSDFAILYRNNSLSRPFEEMLKREGIPYEIIGGISFYQRKEIRDAIAYWRLIVNPYDEEALLRVINFPARGIGKTTQHKLFIAARENGVRPWEVVCNPSRFGIRHSKMEQFATMIRRMQLEAEETPADIIGEAILKESGLLHHYEDGSEESKNRLENLHELIDTLHSYVQESPPDEIRTLGDFLQEVALITTAENVEGPADGVKLLTVHSAKGLEFPVVFIVGLEEGIFPSHFSQGVREDIEEERRLFYVAITRAKDLLYLTRAYSRFRWGTRESGDPSRFIKEIGHQHIEPVHRKSQTPSLPIYRTKVASVYTPPEQPDFQAEPIQQLRPGERIEHNRFGVGQVIEVIDSGSLQKAIINFEAHGKKTIMIKYAKMRRYEST